MFYRAFDFWVRMRLLPLSLTSVGWRETNFCSELRLAQPHVVVVARPGLHNDTWTRVKRIQHRRRTPKAQPSPLPWRSVSKSLAPAPDFCAELEMRTNVVPVTRQR